MGVNGIEVELSMDAAASFYEHLTSGLYLSALVQQLEEMSDHSCSMGAPV